tara:strand:+ start:284 stop:481 length:198 start_codon:yes stop_codon:yes gene_type:complete
MCKGERIIYRPVRTLTDLNQQGTYYSWEQEKWLPILVEEEWEVGGIDACPECQRHAEAVYQGLVA